MHYLSPFLRLTTTLICLVLLSCSNTKSNNTTNSNYAKAMLEQPTTLPNSIWKIFQDSRGIYWFGSNGDGVFQYDGDTLVQFTTSDGLTANQVRGIQEDHNGLIYVETPSGVSQFFNNEFHPIPVLSSKDNEWSLTPEDLWFNCNGDADDVYRYDGKSLIQLKLPRPYLNDILGMDVEKMRYSPFSVFGIDRDRDGNIWFGTGQAGAFRYDGDDFMWVGDPVLCGLPDGRVPGVRRMLQDDDGNMYLSYFMSKYEVTAEDYKTLDVEAINKEDMSRSSYFFNSGLIDAKGNMWMTSYYQNVWMYDGETLTKIPVNGGTDRVLIASIYEDRNGGLWLGTDNDGVYRYDGVGFEKVEI